METPKQTYDKNLQELERKEKIDKVNKSMQELMDYINIDMQKILNPKPTWKD